MKLDNLKKSVDLNSFFFLNQYINDECNDKFKLIAKGFQEDNSNILSVPYSKHIAKKVCA